MTMKIGRAVAYLFGAVMVLGAAGSASAAVPGKALGVVAPSSATQTEQSTQKTSNVIRVAARPWRRGPGGYARARGYRGYVAPRGYRRYAAPRWRNQRAWNNRHQIWRRYPRPPRWGAPTGRQWRYWRGHRYYYYRGGWWPYAWLGGVVVLPSTGYYYRESAPRAVYGPKPWTPAWYSYCASKYRTFNPRTGYYFYAPGKRRFCR